MIIGIDMGHTLNPANYGAVGLKKESEETREVGEKVIQYLKCMGHTVVDVTVDYANTQNESLKQRVAKANAQYLDLLVSLHFNAFDGKRNGSEVYTFRGRKLPQAERVLNNLSKLGFKNSGIFDGSKLYMIRKSKAPAMLVEIAYIDSEKDMKLYEDDLVAQAIVEGITGQKIPAKCIIELEDDPFIKRKNSNSSIRTIKTYKVNVGGTMDYGRAVKISAMLKSSGYTVSIEATE
ncbi:MAG: N-acetylmuramoyl-L-alanine amidase [Clostridium sp.]|uniref:N-acetylmuramoyl-L-alanine amidase n=1 Tax=Clostridium sp. TaxID=1506 RepID=UPI002FC7D286